jgi:hypothetical protein
MAEKKPHVRGAQKKAAPKAADTEGHGAKMKKPTARMTKKAAPAAADTEGHIAARIKGSNKR